MPSKTQTKTPVRSATQKDAAAKRADAKLAKAAALAILRIAPESMRFAGGRSTVVATIKQVLDADASVAQQAVCKLEMVIGITAEALAGRIKSAMPKGKRITDDSRLAHARYLVLECGAPVEEGKTARKLSGGKSGRRDEETHLVIRNAEKLWSGILGETGYGEAVAPKARTAKSKKRKGSGAAGQTKQTGATPPANDTPPEELTADAANAAAIQLAVNAFTYAKAHAKLIDGGIGSVFVKFHAELMAANKARHEAIEAARAKEAAAAAIAKAADAQKAGTLGAAASAPKARKRKAKA